MLPSLPLSCQKIIKPKYFTSVTKTTSLSRFTCFYPGFITVTPVVLVPKFLSSDLPKRVWWWILPMRYALKLNTNISAASTWDRAHFFSPSKDFKMEIYVGKASLPRLFEWHRGGIWSKASSHFWTPGCFDLSRGWAIRRRRLRSVLANWDCHRRPVPRCHTGSSSPCLTRWGWQDEPFLPSRLRH